MNWKNWIVVLLIIFNSGWMLFDGTRALVVGDYITPRAGEYAGRLGPWSNLVKAVGIEPRSTLMKIVFIAYGLAALTIAICLALGLPRTRTAAIIITILGLWYLPTGTAANIIVLILIFVTRR